MKNLLAWLLLLAVLVLIGGLLGYLLTGNGWYGLPVALGLFGAIAIDFKLTGGEY